MRASGRHPRDRAHLRTSPSEVRSSSVALVASVRWSCLGLTSYCGSESNGSQAALDDAAS